MSGGRDGAMFAKNDAAGPRRRPGSVNPSLTK